MGPTKSAVGAAADNKHAPAEKKQFDPEALEASTGKGWLFELLLSYPRRVICVLRSCFRVLHVPFCKWYIVLRYDDVREVLTHDREFPVAWSRKMRGLTNGKNFVLGMKRGAKYEKSYTQLATAFPLEDVAARVAKPAAELASKIVESTAAKANRELDAVEELITTVPARLCESYFGIEVKDPVLFAKWTLAISAYTFGPTPDKRIERLAEAAVGELSGAIRRSIAAAKAGSARGTPLHRLVTAQPGIDDDTIHAQLFGMVLGFIPTNVLAGGNMLETLLRRPDFLERTRTAALADDDELLWRCLREALRFRHINPGPWRACPNGYTLGADGPSPYRIAPGKNVLAIIQSAMFDSRRIERPNVFDPYRRDEDYMVFGVGQHWCLGAYIAKAQITQTFKPLLKREGLRAVRNRSVRTKRFNDLFPLHLIVGFDK